MQFCLDDGSPLVAEPERNLAANADATLHLPGHSTEQPPTIPGSQPSTIRSTQQSTISAVGLGNRPSPPARMSVANDNRRSRSLLWVVLALIIGGSGIAIALIVMRGRQPDNASVSQAGPSSASPGPTLSVTETASSTIDPKRPVNSDDAGQVNRQTEKATPVPKATPVSTPVSKATPVPRATPPAKAEVKEEPYSPPAPRAPISGGVLNGKAVRLVQPSYPAIARTAHVSGTVTVQVVIDESGNVISAHATSGHPLLQSSAVAAARASKFSPTKLSGQPVKVSGVIIYNFQAQ